MTSQLVIFRAFLFIFFRPPPTLGLKKKSRKSTNKKIWPKPSLIKTTLKRPLAHMSINMVLYM